MTSSNVGTYLEDREDSNIKRLTPKDARAMIETAINEAGYIAESSGNSGRRIMRPRWKRETAMERLDLMKVVAKANWRAAIRQIA